jgi:hypothetical protein
VEKIIKFSTRELAERVAAHLYNVELEKESSVLNFIKFDRTAFELVLKLESILEQDYFFVQAKPHQLESQLILRQREPQFQLTRDFNYNFNVDPNTVQQLSNCFSKIEKAMLAVSFQLYKSQRLTELVFKEEGE